VSYGFESVADSNLLFEFWRKTLFDFHNLRAPRANQMMVVPIISFFEQLKAGHAIAKIKAFDDLHRFEQVQGAIYRHEVAKTLRQGGENLFVGHRVRLLAQDFEYRLPRTGQLSRAPAQARRQNGERGTGAIVFVHLVQYNTDNPKRRPNRDRRELSHVEPMDVAAFKKDGR
jgi:hypothetical protein